MKKSKPAPEKRTSLMVSVEQKAELKAVAVKQGRTLEATTKRAITRFLDDMGA